MLYFLFTYFFCKSVIGSLSSWKALPLFLPTSVAGRFKIDLKSFHIFLLGMGEISVKKGFLDIQH